MASSITAHIDSFMLGMKTHIVEVSKQELNTAAELDKTFTKITTDFRNIYDSLMPNIHVIDMDNISIIISNDIVNNPEKYFTIKGSNSSNIQTLASQVLTDNVLKTLRKNIRDGLKTFHSNLPKGNFKGNNPIEYLNTLMNEFILSTESYLSNDSYTMENKSARVFELGYKFRQSIFSIFNIKSMLQIGAASFGLPNPDKYLVFFGKSFSGMKSSINSIINDSVLASLNSSIKVSQVFTTNKSAIDKLIHFGHSAVKYKEETETETEGGELVTRQVTRQVFQSPGYQKLVYNTLNISKPTSQQLKALNPKYIKETKHYKHSIVINKDLTKAYGAVVRIGISFTQDQLRDINLGMAPQEGLSSGGKGSSNVLKQGISVKNVVSALKNHPLVKEIATDTASPSLVDMARDKLVAAFSGKAPKLLPKYVSKQTGTTNVQKLKKVKTPSNLIKTAASVSSTNNISIIPSKSKPNWTYGAGSVNLTSLQSLINSHLQNVISANMGDGSSKRILNYRTGRFAASAKVETMSQSRQGMITAFYSYMKNPYQTFEPGFKQGSPKTRDPKLLISQSIREIAATRVGNQLRAQAL